MIKQALVLLSLLLSPLLSTQTQSQAASKQASKMGTGAVVFGLLYGLMPLTLGLPPVWKQPEQVHLSYPGKDSIFRAMFNLCSINSIARMPFQKALKEMMGVMM